MQVFPRLAGRSFSRFLFVSISLYLFLSHFPCALNVFCTTPLLASLLFLLVASTLPFPSSYSLSSQFPSFLLSPFQPHDLSIFRFSGNLQNRRGCNIHRRVAIKGKGTSITLFRIVFHPQRREREERMEKWQRLARTPDSSIGTLGCDANHPKPVANKTWLRVFSLAVSSRLLSSAPSPFNSYMCRRWNSGYAYRRLRWLTAFMFLFSPLSLDLLLER